MIKHNSIFTGGMLVYLLFVVGCGSSSVKSDKPDPVKNTGLTFEFNNCQQVAGDVHCLIYITAGNRDTLVDIAGKSRLIDTKGVIFGANFHKTANTETLINHQIADRIKIMGNSRVQSILVFHRAAQSAARINRLEIVFAVQSPQQSGEQVVSFSNINL